MQRDRSFSSAFRPPLTFDGNRSNNKHRSTLYEDDYGVLELMSTQTLDQPSRSQDRSVEEVSKSLPWFVRIRAWFLKIFIAQS